MLWEKKDNLYAEGLTARVSIRTDIDFIFYHKNKNSQFFISNYGVYTMNIDANNTFTNGPMYSYIKGEITNTTFTYANGSTISIPAVFIATNGFGEEGAVLFKIENADNDTIGSSPNFGFVNAKGCNFRHYRQGLEEAWILLNLTYKQSSNSYEFTLRVYDCSLKMWYDKVIIDSSTEESLKMPSDYSPYSYSEYFPKFVVYMSDDGSYNFSNFFGYSVNILESEAEEIIKNGRIFYSKTNGGMHALFYNECTSSDYYPNTTFYQDGTVIPRGELVEGAVNQICKNGDIKSQEFIEY